jgi:hypothetical protein
MGLLLVLHGMTNLTRIQHISWLVVGVESVSSLPNLNRLCPYELCDATLICGGRNQWRFVRYEAPAAFFHAVRQTFKNSQCLRDPKISYRVQCNLPLCQMNIASKSLSIIFKYVFNIILSYTQTNKLVSSEKIFYKFIISRIRNYVHPFHLP